MDFKEYFDYLLNTDGVVADLSVDPNANVAQKSIASVMQEVSKPFMKEYCLSKLYGYARERGFTELEKKIKDGELYVSDSHMLYAPYCWNFSVSHLMAFGLPFIPRVPSSPLPTPTLRTARRAASDVRFQPSVGCGGAHELLRRA